MIFGNCRSLHNKVDELRANCRFLNEFRESCCIGLTETWLNELIPDSSIDIPNFTPIRLDRSGETSKSKGGGVMLYVNNQWCNNITIKSSECNNNIEILTVNLRPFYLPREFTNIFLTVLYIPPSANKAIAAEYIQELANDLATAKPDALQIILGDVNRTPLKLPTFKQYVSCNTRKDACLDHFYCNTKDAYKSIQGPPLKNSDHNMIMMQPTSRRKLASEKNQKKQKSFNSHLIVLTPSTLALIKLTGTYLLRTLTTLMN